MASRLQIGAEQTTLDIDDGSNEPDQVVLAIGTASVARRYFHHQPPSAAELEAAIEIVENALMPSVPRLRGPGPLLTHDDEAIALAAFAGINSGMANGTSVELDLENLERQFNRLADVANGRPASYEGLPERPSFAAYLPILRELMHHTGRSTIRISAE